jgi:hypothetical protein
MGVVLSPTVPTVTQLVNEFIDTARGTPTVPTVTELVKRIVDTVRGSE